MRLAFLLSSTLLLAQTPRNLPWNGLASPPWQAGEPMPVSMPCEPAPKPAPEETLVVRLSGDGALRVSDPKGIIRLRIGLPGRPAQLWRDGGERVDCNVKTLLFPANTPLSKGLGALPWNSPDFRNALSGLLWSLDDGQRLLTIVHPATGQVAFIPLPQGKHLTLCFHPQCLELRDSPKGDVVSRDSTSWIVPWVGLLPQLVRLGPQPPTKPGTALQPFPKE